MNDNDILDEIDHIVEVVITIWYDDEEEEPDDLDVLVFIDSKVEIDEYEKSVVWVENLNIILDEVDDELEMMHIDECDDADDEVIDEDHDVWLHTIDDDEGDDSVIVHGGLDTNELLS